MNFSKGIKTFHVKRDSGAKIVRYWLFVIFCTLPFNLFNQKIPETMSDEDS